jgi:hypothetical protein
LNLLLRLLPFFVGLAVTYPIATSLASSSRPTKFAVVSLMALCLGHAFTWFNIYLARRGGDLLEPPKPGPRALGHSLMLAGALLAGYGFSVDSTIALIAAVVCLWVADDKLTPQAASGRQQSRRQLPTQPGEFTPQEQGFLDAALLDVKEHPGAVLSVGSKVVLRRLLDMMTDTQPTHIESLLCALGALAGYACQASLREHARNQGLEETALFVVAETADGARYFFGDPLNEVLAESKTSVWNLAAAAALRAGGQDLPDMNEMFAHVTSTVGHQDFGIPRLPPGHSSQASPLQMLRTYWPMLAPLARKFCATPGELPVLFALGIQDAIHLGKSQVPPRVAFLIAMESALPMSKIDFPETRP